MSLLATELYKMIPENIASTDENVGNELQDECEETVDDPGTQWSQEQIERLLPNDVSHEEIGVVIALINVIRQFALAVSLLIWTIVGFLFWIPMLIYSIVRFSALIVYATIMNTDPNSLAIQLERAVRFYLEGFRNVIKAIYHREADTPATAKLTIETIEITKIIVHVTCTFLFWLAVTAVVLSLTGGFGQWLEALDASSYNKQPDSPVNQEVNRKEIVEEAKQTAFGSRFRTWTSADGNFNVEARFINYLAGKVTLEKKNNVTLSIDLDRLSHEDQELIRDFLRE